VQHAEFMGIAIEPVAKKALDLGQDHGPVLRMEKSLECLEFIGQLMIGEAQLLFPFFREKQAARAQVPVPDAVVGAANGQRELFAAVAQGSSARLRSVMSRAVMTTSGTFPLSSKKG
jgi:hypothetical protein